MIDSSTLRSAQQIQLESMRIENLRQKAADPDLVKVPGFDEITDMEAELEKIQTELAARRADVERRQQSLESSMESLEKARKRLAEGDAMSEASKAILSDLEEAVFHSIGDSSGIEAQKRNQAIWLHLINERFAKIWPKVRKKAVDEIARLEKEIEKLKGENTNV